MRKIIIFILIFLIVTPVLAEVFTLTSEDILDLVEIPEVKEYYEQYYADYYAEEYNPIFMSDEYLKESTIDFLRELYRRKAFDLSTFEELVKKIEGVVIP